MCYELYKDGRLVYTDCLVEESDNTSRIFNSSNATNDTFAYKQNETLNTTTEVLRGGVNTTRNGTTSSAGNFTKEELNDTCCACYQNASQSIGTEITYDYADNASVVVAQTSNSTVVVQSTGVIVTHEDKGHWVVVLLCITLFVLCGVYRYARTLRWRNTMLEKYTSTVTPSTEVEDDQVTEESKSDVKNSEQHRNVALS